MIRALLVISFWAAALSGGVLVPSVSFGASPGDSAREFSDRKPIPDYFAHPMRSYADVSIILHDGVRLSADIYLPVEEGAKPTVFTLTPYNNQPLETRYSGAGSNYETAWHFVQRGYAFVSVDSRGRHDSDGTFYPFRGEGKDGSDVISWIASQPWSNGKVATLGASYTAWNQWYMAKERNPHHTAIMSYVAPLDAFTDWPNWNGVMKLRAVPTWLIGAMYGRVNEPQTDVDWDKAMRHLPLITLDRALGRDIKAWQEFCEHDSLDSFWEEFQMDGHWGTFDIPSFHVTGWWDTMLESATRAWKNTLKYTRHPNDHMLVIGPWLHGVDPSSRKIGTRDFGPEAIVDLEGLRDQWLDHVMRGSQAPSVPAVMYFLPGLDQWKRATSFPIEGTKFTKYYLDGNGPANTAAGHGSLSLRAPKSGHAEDRFTYDPANPVPTVSSRMTRGAATPQEPVDNRNVESRDDVLVYTSDAFPEATEITGPVSARIFFATDVPDTDITVKLLDVLPDGAAMNLSHGIARARYRTSYRSPTLLEAGKVYSLDVELYPTSNYFRAGHRVRVEVSSSNFPDFARNLNTGKNSNTTAELRLAHTRILRSAANASYIELPIVPSNSSGR